MPRRILILILNLLLLCSTSIFITGCEETDDITEPVDDTPTAVPTDSTPTPTPPYRTPTPTPSPNPTPTPDACALDAYWAGEGIGFTVSGNQVTGDYLNIIVFCGGLLANKTIRDWSGNLEGTTARCQINNCVDNYQQLTITFNLNTCLAKADWTYYLTSPSGVDPCYCADSGTITAIQKY